MNENKNTDILEYEDIFKEELKLKEKKEMPEQQKSRFGFSILYYIFVMFILASIIQLLFLANDSNIKNYTAEETMLLELYEDANGIGIIDTEIYENNYESSYGSYFEQSANTLNDYTILYHSDLSYLIDVDTEEASTTISNIINGNQSYWDINDMNSAVSVYITEDATLISQISPTNLYTMSLYALMLDDMANDQMSIAIIEKDLYDTYYAQNNSDIATINYDDDFYVIYHKDNETIPTLTTNDLKQILIGSSSINTYHIYRVEGQLSSDISFLYVESTTYIDYGSTMTGFASGLANFIIYLLLLPVLLYILKPTLIYDFDTFKKVEKSKIIQGLVIGYVFLILGNYISQLISTLLSWAFNQPIEQAINQLTIEQTLMSNGAIFMIISAIIIGPIVEELIFRKSIFGLIKNQWVALTVSSVVFGAIHLIGEPSLVSALINGSSYIIMGFVFGYIYIKNDKNIFYPTLVHIVSNLISILAVYFLF